MVNPHVAPKKEEKHLYHGYGVISSLWTQWGGEKCVWYAIIHLQEGGKTQTQTWNQCAHVEN